MKDNHIVIQLRLPASPRGRFLLGLGVLVMSVGALAYATVPNTFNTGDKLSADLMNANFRNLDKRATDGLWALAAGVGASMCYAAGDHSGTGILPYRAGSTCAEMCGANPCLGMPIVQIQIPSKPINYAEAPAIVHMGGCADRIAVGDTSGDPTIATTKPDAVRYCCCHL